MMTNRLTNRQKGLQQPTSPSDPIFVISKRRPRGDIENDLDSDETDNHNHKSYCNPVYLKTHFDIMYYIGISPIRGNGKRGSRIQKVQFGIVTGLAILHSFLRVKQFIVDILQKGKLLDYIRTCHLITGLLVQLYFCKLITWNRDSVSSILDQATQRKAKIVYKNPAPKISGLVVFLACLRVSMAVAAALRPDWWLEGDTPSSILLARSERVSRFIFLWSKDANRTSELELEYGTNLNTTSVLMGSFGFVFQFFLNLHEKFISDILLMAALHSHRLSQICQSNIQDTLGNDMPNDRTLPMMRETHNVFVSLLKCLEDGFGRLFIMLHVANYIFCSYFLLDALRGETDNVFLPETTVMIPAITCTYIFAAKAIAKTKMIKNMIEDRDCDNDHIDEKGSSKVAKFLKKIKRSPIGIGQGNFLVDETFAQRFVGAVISTFLLFVDKTEKEL